MDPYQVSVMMNTAMMSYDDHPILDGTTTTRFQSGPSLVVDQQPPPPTMQYNDHAFVDFDITAQLNAYNESLMNGTNSSSSSTPELQPEGGGGGDFLQFNTNTNHIDTQQQQQHADHQAHQEMALLQGMYADQEEEEIYNNDDHDDHLLDDMGDDHDDQYAMLNYPPRRLSSFNMSLRDAQNGTSQRQALVLQHRNPTSDMPPALPEVMADAWNGLSPAARAHFEGLAAHEREEYVQARRAADKVKQATAAKKAARKAAKQKAAAAAVTVGTNTITTTPIMPPPPPLLQQQQQLESLSFTPESGNAVPLLSQPQSLSTAVPPCNNNNNNMHTATTDLSFMTPSYRRAIAELATKLDDASIDFLIRSFK